MDKQSQPNSITTSTHLPPAQLIVGSYDMAAHYAQEFLQKQFCKAEGCGVCTSCRNIRLQEHPYIIWLEPEKQYTLQDLDIIFHTLSFELNRGDHFFFVLQKADTLTQACANSLLKSIEEPPHGYHFVLLAQRLEVILPTIRSRCLVKTLSDTSSFISHETLFAHFTHKKNNPISFLKDLDHAKITEFETLTLMDQILAYWSEQYKQALSTQDTKAIKKTSLILKNLEHALTKTPMPGSSKLFWKNLYLTHMQTTQNLKN